MGVTHDGEGWIETTGPSGERVKIKIGNLNITPTSETSTAFFINPGYIERRRREADGHLYVTRVFEEGLP